MGVLFYGTGNTDDEEAAEPGVLGRTGRSVPIERAANKDMVCREWNRTEHVFSLAEESVPGDVPGAGAIL